ncbi:hypothetical protein CHUAL_009372 [Chamberlinius hualienensis]
MQQHTPSPSSGRMIERFRENERPKVPYKLLQLKSGALHGDFWDHQRRGESFQINAFTTGYPVVSLSCDILTNAIDLLKSSKNESVKYSVICDLDTSHGRSNLLLHPKATNEMYSQKKIWRTLTSTIELIDEQRLNNFYCFDYSDFDQLKQHALAISLCGLFCLRGKFCISFNEAWKIDLVLSLAVLSVTFVLDAISTVSIIPTALSKGLSDPTVNCLLHEQPKSGFITMDATYRALLVLDSDPKLKTLPVFGIWISGVHRMTDPYVWGACCRYFYEFHNCNASRVKEPFLVIIYAREEPAPSFYDCKFDDISDTKKGTELDVLQASHSWVLSEDNVDKPFLLEMEKKYFNLSVSQCLKLKCFAHKRKKGKLEGLQKVNPVSPALLDCNKKPCLPSTPVFDTVTETVEAESTSNEIVQSRPLNELYKLIRGQEEELKVLRAQLDSLLQNRAGLSPPVSKQTEKATVSTSTMTSRVWTTSQSGFQVDEIGCNMKLPENDSGAMSEITRQDEKSEISSFHKVEDNLANLQFQTCTDTVLSSAPSLRVDFDDFPTLQSMSEWPVPSPDERSSSDSGKNYDFSYLDSSLDKIRDTLEKCLREQNLRKNASDPELDIDVRLSNSNSSHRSIFNSWMIPSLNYLSLLPSEQDTDYTMDLQAVTKKYCKDEALRVGSSTATPIPLEQKVLWSNTETRECAISYASQQYLKKYGLGNSNSDY